MRESVKNKKRLIVTAIAVIIALLLSVTTGLLIYNPNGTKNGVTDGLLGNVADNVDITKSTTGTYTSSGLTIPSNATAINNETDLKNVINGNGVGYLNANVSLNWGNTGNTNKFSGTIYGQGKTITLLSSGEDWKDAQRIDGTTGINRCTGAFVGLNAGKIYDVTFKYEGTSSSKRTWAITSPKHTISTMGIVCGENTGTIQNVRLDMNYAYIRFHAGVAADSGNGNKIIFGSICGAQSGILNNVLVNIARNGEVRLEVDAKNWTRVAGAECEALQMGVVGGVYGTYTSPTAALNTSNLMVIGGSQATIAVQNSGSRDTADQRENTGCLDLVGAVAGMNIKGVRGVVWDYQGEFECQRYTYDKNNYVCDGFQTSKVAANAGIPTGYYSSSADYACMNGASWMADFQGNTLTSNTEVPFTPNAPRVRDVSDAARGKINRNFGTAKIDMAQYDERFGAIEMRFTNTVGELNIKKSGLSGSSANDVFFRVGEAATNSISTNPVVNYATSTRPTSFDTNFNIAGDNRFEIVTGKKFNSLKVLAGQTYTGADYITLFAAQAFNDAAAEIKTVQQDNEVSFDKSKVKFMQGNVALTSFIYPQKDVTIVIRDNNDNNYSYVDQTNRFAFGLTTLSNLRMDPANISGGVTYSSDWTQSKLIQIKVSSPSYNSDNKVRSGIIDRIEYRVKDSGTDYTSVPVSYDINNGLQFSISDNTYGVNGYNYEIIGYKKDASSGIDYKVLFASFSTNSDTIIPYTISNIKIDTNKPKIGTDAFNDLAIPNLWYNYNKTVTFDISDEQSGIKNTEIKIEKAVPNSDGTFGSYSNHSFTNNNNGTITVTFDEYAKYRVYVEDNAQNNESYEFIVQIDKADPNTISNLDIFYFVKTSKPDGTIDELPYGTSSTKSVFARMTANFGPAGGIIQFAPVNDNPQDPANTRDTVTHSTNNVFEAEIKSTVDTGVCYAFTLISNAVGQDGVTKHQKRFESTVVILVQQERIDVYISDINIISENGLLTKVFDKNNQFDLSNISVNFAQDEEGQERKAAAEEVFKRLNEQGGNYDINKFNDYLNIVSAGFYSDTHGDHPVTDANEGTSDIYYLIIEIRVDSLYDFTIRNGQEQNNYYVFAAQDVNNADAVKYQVNSQLKVVDTVGIEKKSINQMTVNNTEKTYWTENPEFSVTFGQGELLDGDNIDEFITYSTSATKESTAGRNYSVTATILDTCRNYKLAKNANTTGYLRVTRAIISNIYIEGELNSITCFEVPKVSAYFYDVRNQKVNLDIIYKNEDREEVQFIPGKRAAIGKYFYVILLDEKTLVNYVNLSDPNMLIGHFNVVGDKVEEGRNFHIRDLDTKTKNIIEVEFINDIIDFRSLIDFEETALRDKMQIYYGPGQEATSFINEVGTANKHGEYIVTLEIKRGDDRYAAFTKEYAIQVIPAQVFATDSDLIAPVEEVPEGSQPIDGVYFDNKVVNLNESSISTSLREKLNSLLTEEEIAAGGVDSYYTFTFAYKKNNRTINANRVIDAGSYAVNLKISGEKINTIEISTVLNILKLRLDVKYDTDKYSQIEGVDVVTDNKGTSTIKKTFDGFDNPINISLDSAFESELRRLLGLESGEVGYILSDNDLTEAGSYTVGLSLTSINDNIELTNNLINIVISQRTVTLDVNGLVDTYQGKDKHYLWLTQNDIDRLMRFGDIKDPFIDPDDAEAQGINSLYFGISQEYRDKGVIAIRKYPVYEEDGVTIKEPGQIGLYFPNSGSYTIPIRMRVPDPNFRIGNGSLVINIAKAPVNSITLVAEYNQDGELNTIDIPKNGSFTMEYNGDNISFKIGEEGKKQLIELGVDESELTFENNVVKNAGTYKVRVSVDNDNILSDAYEIEVVITKKKIGDKIGKFDSTVWLIDENTPNTEQLENGIMYNKDENGYESVYSIRLIDHDQLIAEGFSITYFYDGKEVKGVTKAGSYTVTAKISRANDSDNWETRTIELWKLDKNGDYVLQDTVIYDKDANGNDIPKKDDEAQVTEKRRVVEYFTIAKSEDLQAQIDSDPEFLLADKETVYDGTEQSIKFTDAQLKKYADADIEVVMKKNAFIEAGEYTVLVTFYRLIKGSNGVKDKNYEPAEMEATFTIKPIEVQIFFEYGEQYRYEKDGLNARYDEGGLIDVVAYYIDKDGIKVKITSFITEKMFGSGDELDFSGLDKFDDGSDKILPGNFQMTAVITDTNYAFNEDDAVNYFRFNIKSQTKTINTVLYILLALLIIMIVSAALIFWYVFRLYNPACQDIDLDGTENF